MKPTKGLVGGQYKPLTQDNIGRIHETSLRVLEEVGVRVDSDEAREIFAFAGATLDSADGRVKVKPRAVEEALRDVPSRVRLCGRKDMHDLVASGRRSYFGTGGAATKVIDLDTGECRHSRLADIADFARLAEELPNIHFFVRPCTARDVPPDALAVNEFYAALANTTKHVMGGAYSPEGVKQVTTMARMIAGSERALRERPLITFIVGWMNSPLSFGSEGTQTLIEAVKSDVPVVLSSAPMAGSTSPITLAGTLVQLHAEELAGLVFTQIVRPGAPVIYGGIPSMADMRHLRYIGGGVEFGMMNAAIAQLSHYIKVPNYNSAGITEAKIPDIQAVYEKSFAILQCALSGSNCIHHAAGMLESLLTISHEQLIIDNEIIGMAIRAIRGIEVDEDRLAFEAIRESVAEGNYLSSDHTIRFMRDEFFEPMLADRNAREQWEEIGMNDLREKAREKAREMLRDRPVLPDAVSQQADKEIRRELGALLV